MTTMDEKQTKLTPQELLQIMREHAKKDTKRKVGEATARGTIAGLRARGHQIPITPYLIAAADDMQALLNEVLRYRKKEKEEKKK